ncbi:MAG: OmpL47-type beta-barrel domain-containing protein [Nocardioidaceae bacterium]
MQTTARSGSRGLSSPLIVMLSAVTLVLSLGLVAFPALARPSIVPQQGVPQQGDARQGEAQRGEARQTQAQVLTWTAGDDFTQYASAPTTAVAGHTTIVFENSAATGNTTGMQHTLTFETNDPSYNSDVDVDILADPYDSNGGRHQVDVMLTPGTYRYFCSIPGHGAMTGELVVTDAGGDATAPTVSAAVSGDQDENGDYVGSATVTLSASDSGSGVSKVEYSLDGQPYGNYSAPVTVNQPGDHTLTYRATDNAGNTSSPQSETFTVVEPPTQDTTPPTVTAQVTGERDASGAYVGSATVTLTAADTESGVERIEYSLDGIEFGTYTQPVTITQPGQHTVTYRATDNAGNTSAPQSETFTVVEPPTDDTTPPTVTAQVTGQQNTNGDYIGSATVTLTATDTDSGVDTVEYSLDGAAYTPYTNPLTVNQPGDHSIAYRATDNAGNTSPPQSETFTVVEPPTQDTTPPTVTAQVTGEQNTNGDYIGSATVTLTATDTDSGVDTVEYSLDGAAYTSYTNPVTVNQPGDHSIAYRATDNAGNTSGTASSTFSVVASGPDGCPVPDTRPTVWLGTVDSGVANRVVDGDCTINNLIEDERDWSSHGRFVRHAKAVARHLHHQGVIDDGEYTAIVETAAHSGVGKPEEMSGYARIFDGSQESFAQWEHVGDGGFHLNPDGTITSDPQPGLGMLWYPTHDYGDFSLKLQWRDDAPADGNTNSGVFVRFPHVHQHPDEDRPAWVAIKYGHEIQILDRPDGDQYKSGSIYGFDRVDLTQANPTDKDTWNDYEIRVVDQHYSVYRNGELINEYLNDPDATFTPPRADDPGGAGRQHPRGYVGLQNHGTTDVITFRNIRVAPLTSACPHEEPSSDGPCCC